MEHDCPHCDYKGEIDVSTTYWDGEYHDVDLMLICPKCRGLF